MQFPFLKGGQRQMIQIKNVKQQVSESALSNSWLPAIWELVDKLHPRVTLSMHLPLPDFVKFIF